MSYSDDNEFEVATDDEYYGSERLTARGIEGDNTFVQNVSVVSPSSPIPHSQHSESDIVSDTAGKRALDKLRDSDDDSFSELHERGNKMRLSKLPPESLLRKYNAAIASALNTKKVG